MRIFSKRIRSLAIKEILTLFRDPKGRAVLIFPPIIQLLIFSFAATLEVKNIELTIFNQDRGIHSTEIIQRIATSTSFIKIIYANNFSELENNIDTQKTMVALNIPIDFSRNIIQRQSASIQVILDGRRSNAAQIVFSYLSTIVNTYANEINSSLDLNAPKINIIHRNWFNQNLLYIWTTVPSLVCILSMIVALVITSLSVARERELGTFDQILVSPLLSHEILIGKTIPAVIVGLIEGLIIWAIGITFFSVPFTGSLLLLIPFMAIFIMSVVGIGLFISALSKTQQQAFLGTFIFMVPTITLSGYATPIENMPDWLQPITWFNPLAHALVISKGLFLKNMSVAEAWSNCWPLFIIALLMLSLAGITFARKLE